VVFGWFFTTILNVKIEKLSLAKEARWRREGMQKKDDGLLKTEKNLAVEKGSGLGRIV
jgi:hypothetical protein